MDGRLDLRRRMDRPRMGARVGLRVLFGKRDLSEGDWKASCSAGVGSIRLGGRT